MAYTNAIGQIIQGFESSCKAGEMWDPIHLVCIPHDAPYACPFGQVWDWNQYQCVDVFLPPTSIGNPVDPFTPSQTPPSVTPTATSTTQGPITVNINNAIAVVDNGIKDVADAVSGAIVSSASHATNIAKQTADEITQAVSSVASNIFDAAKTAISTIYDWIKRIGSVLGDNVGALISFITDNLGSLIKKVADTLSTLIPAAVNLINSVAQQIQKINDTFIQPISTIILSTIQTISTLTTALEADIHNGLKGLLQIPTDIANSLSSLDATILRSIDQMNIGNKEIVNTTLGGTKEDTIWTRLKTMGDSITKLGSGTKLSTTFQDVSHLTEPDIAAAGAKTFDAIWKEIITFVSDLFSFGKPSIEALKTLPIAIPFILGETIEFPMLIIALVIAFVEAMDPLLEFIKDDINLKSGLAKLGPSDAIAAWVRQFINDKDLEEELGVRGWDESRIRVLKDLQTFLLDTQTAIDLYFRGVITLEELQKNMSQKKITVPDQEALLLASYRLIDVNTASRAFLRGIITEEQLTDVMSEHRYTENETALYKSVLFQPETVEFLIERHKRNSLYSNHLTHDPIFNTLPSDILEAAKRNGEDEQTAADKWMFQFPVPSIQHWINLMFRGIRTHTEVMSAMDYFRVPSEWRDDYIRSQESLIPFRTIPAMMAAGIIDEPYAKQQLQAHGFSLQATNALLSYANRKTKNATATTAVKMHDESVTVASELHHLGAITDAQLTEVLLAHGFTQSAVDAQLQLSQLKQQLQHRKDVVNEVVGQVLAGVLTYEDAQQALSQAGLSTGEIAKALKQIRSNKNLQAKLPSEAELVKMVKANIIDADRYIAVLEQIGYSQEWALNFATLRFAPAGDTTT